MAKTIELQGLTLTAIQAVWKPQYYTKQESWHLRVSYPCMDDDEDIECLADLSRDAADAEIVTNVAAWLFDVDAMTDAERQAVRDMIEVKR